MSSESISVVTGATGRIGFALLDCLKKNGVYVRALCRGGIVADEVRKIADEVIIGDILDKDILMTAFEGAEYVYHLAGVVSIESKLSDEVYEVNVTGTKNVVDACIECGVRRLIYTGTVHTLPFKDKKHPITEIPRFLPDQVSGGYAVSKALASNIVLDAAERGLDAVIGMPSGVVGAYEYKLSNLGQMVVNVANRKLPCSLTGEYDFVDTKDVAQALYDLSKLGVKGESYLISGHKVKVKELVRYAARAAQVKPPFFCVPLWLAKLFAPIAERRALKKKQLPLFTPYSLRVLGDNCNFSHEKLTKLTGYNPRPVEEAIKDQVDFYFKYRK